MFEAGPDHLRAMLLLRSIGCGVQMRSRTVRAAAVLAALLMVLGVVAEVAGPAVARPRLVSTKSFADPSVLPFRGGYFALATGDDAPGAWAPRPDGPWQATGPTLVRVPGWAANAGVWAADATRIAGHYVMYYSVPVRGLGREGRCIGAAVSRSPLQKFLPVPGNRPLVCPGAASARRAPDGVRTHASRLPRRGVIDPSVLRIGGRHYLLYKTQGTPATIRIVRLGRRGLTTRGHSHQLLQTRGISENPVIVRHGRSYYLLTSEGYFAGCGYSTTWRRSRSLFHWQGSRQHVLMRSRGTGVCGPGGADVVQRAGRGHLVFFHGWVCGASHACSNRGVTHNGSARRGLYAGRLVWHRGTPHVVSLDPPHHSKRHHHKKHAKKKHHRHGTRHLKRKHRAHHHKHRRHHAKKRHHVERRHRVRRHHATRKAERRTTRKRH